MPEDKGKKKDDEGDIDQDLSLVLWNSLTNLMCWIMFRAMLESRGDAEAEEMVDKILLEWKGRLLKDVNVKINDLANLRQSLPGNVFDGMIPDEEQTRVKFSKSIKAVEALARQMLLEKAEGEEE